MFAQSYYPSAYVPPYSHQQATAPSLSPRARYVSAISRVQEAETEYRAYLAQQQREQERVRALQIQRERIREHERVQYLAQQERIRQQRTEERARVQLQQLQLQEQQRRRAQEAHAVKLLVHAAVTSLLNAEASQRPQRQPVADSNPNLPTQNPETRAGAQLVGIPCPYPSSCISKLTSRQQRRNHVRVVRSAPTQARESTRPADVESVRTALRRRLASEPNVEVHATIRRILAKLPSASTPEPKSAPGKVSTKTEPEAKSTPASEIQKIERAFRALASEFVFPAQLDFSFTSTPTPVSPTFNVEPQSPAPTLAYTPRNAPLRQYEHALNALLARLDAVESLGDEGVRAERRRVVGLIEGALEGVGRVVEGRWKLVDVGARKTSVVNAVTPVAEASTQTPATEEQPQVTPAPSPSSAPSVEINLEAAPVGTTPPSSISIPETTSDSETTKTQTASVPTQEEPRVVADFAQPSAALPAPEIDAQEGGNPREFEVEADLESPREVAATLDNEKEPTLVAPIVEAPPVEQAESPVVDTTTPAAVPADEESQTLVPAVEESESRTPAEDPADVPASPKSLSLSAPLPEELVGVVVEASDSESSYSDSDSVGSWSEVEGA
ncbi:hypothetical protein B0H16DRAFT_138761 [Mycena metata]|uniref:BAG domain-containing protein n=1 Tax=Mycena metata TaxID=1033252 RepID=A0AAD7JVY5_9AGAR|nr:hypothetical protein B0H16DRAFT_138761 [Mycena metata]